MNKLTLFLFIASFVCARCHGQIKEDKDFIYFEGKIEEYKADSCLIDLMWTIVEADSANLKYPPNAFFYELNFTNKESVKEIFIKPSRWLKSSTLDYNGVVLIGDMSFLCKGDFKSDSLFKGTDNYVDVTLRCPNLYKYDSIDVKIEMFVYKPSLMGKYTFCQGGVINLYVLVGEKLEGFDTIE